MKQSFWHYTKKVLYAIAVALCLILGGAVGTYLYLTHTFHVPLHDSIPHTPSNILETREKDTATTPASVEDTQHIPNDAHPGLSESQEKSLEKIGIDPATLPTTLSDTQQNCLIDAVGEDRANAIKNGETPTLFEITKGLACMKESQ